MGNKSAEKKRKKKRGRPSLLDVQKRSLRLRQLPPNRNPNSSDDEDLGSSAKKREKKLKFLSDPVKEVEEIVIEEDGEKAMDAGSVVSYVHSLFDLVLTGDAPDSGPATPLPDRNLLLVVLDRLQKKDTYGVYSEPVEPGELPDYFDIIKHPMDFGTVRKKLAAGAYVNLEQFEKDVFLISSNAMQYNAQDTIYFRQARAIHELAKKDFESLRQGDDIEPEPKVVRRGRPPNKNKIKQTVGRLPAEPNNFDFSSNATLANVGDDSHWSTSEKNDEYSGSVLKGIQMKYGKKPSIIEDNRRDTYKESHQGVYVREPSVFTAFDQENKLLVPVGLQMELAYARSLARFAAKLGPVGWDIAARQIERVLSAGTAFGRGWVVDGQVTRKPQKPVLSTCPPQLSSRSKNPQCTATVREGQLTVREEPPENNLAVEDGPTSATVSPSPASTITSDNAESDPLGSVRGSNQEGRSNPMTEDKHLKLNASFQSNQKPSAQPTVNGFNTTVGFSLSQVVNIARPPVSFGLESALTTHVALRGTSSSSNGFTSEGDIKQFVTENVEFVGNPSALNSDSPMPDSTGDLIV